MTSMSSWLLRSSHICDECRETLKTSAALMNHRGGRRCQIAKTQKIMRARGWEEVTNTARRVLSEAEVEYEEAPTALVPGGLKRNVNEPTWRAPLTKAGKPRYGRVASAEIIMGLWAPVWAARFLNAVFKGFAGATQGQLGGIVTALNFGARSDECAASLTAAYALGGLDAVAALIEPQQEEGDDHA